MGGTKTKEELMQELAEIDSQLGELGRRRLATLTGFYCRGLETDLENLTVALVAFRGRDLGMTHETVREYTERFADSVQDFLKSVRNETEAQPGV